jgi:mercuric ion transport protein
MEGRAIRALFGVGLVGTIVAALCCLGVLTPLLVAGLVAVGLGALTRSLDAVLVPALVVFVVLTVVGWYGRRQAPAAGGRPDRTG